MSGKQKNSKNRAIVGTVDKVRRRRIATIRNDIAEGERTRIALVRTLALTKLRAAIAANRSVTLLPAEAEAIVREGGETRAKSGRGAPSYLADFHKWMAIDALLRRRPRKYLESDGQLAEEWGVSVGAVHKCVRAHGKAARTMIATLDRAVLAGTARHMATAFCALGGTAT